MLGLQTAARAQTLDDILNLLVSKGAIQQEEADSLRAEAAVKAQVSRDKQKAGVWLSKNMQLIGYIQTRYQHFEQGQSAGGFDIRRARLNLQGDIHVSWEYRLQVDMAGQPKILDAYAVYKPWNFMKFQAGSFKVPWSQDNLMASGKMEFIDRSQVTEALVSRSRDVLGNNNGRDIGVMIFGSLLKVKGRYLVDYYAGVFNGQGLNVTDKNKAKDIMARLLFHPIKGLDAGVAYVNGYDNFILKPDTGNFVRFRYAGECSYTWKRLTLKGEYIAGGDGNIKKEGFFAQAGFFVWPGRLQLLAKYDQFEPDKARGKDITVYYTGGLNFFFNEYAKIGINYSYRTEEGGSDFQVKNDLLSIQLQAGF